MSPFPDGGVAFQTRVVHLRDLAEHLQWQYTPTVPWQSLPYAESFELFRHYRQSVTNVVSGMAGAVQVIIFDYSFEINPGGKIHYQYCQTVAMFGTPSLNLPLCQLHPRNFSRRFGSGSIGFPGYPKFAEQYFVTGSDQPAIRNLLNPPLINALENNPGWSIEGGGGQFFFYREEQMVAPEQMQWLVETGQQVLRLMETSERSGATA